MRLLIRWLINAIALIVVSRLISGFRVDSFTDALIAAAVFGIVNSTLGLVLKILTFPLTIVTFGLFLIVINAAMLKFAARIMLQSYSGVYGPLGLVPLVLVWIYSSWLLVLLGAEIAHSLQNLRLLEAEDRRQRDDEPINGLLAAQLLSVVAAAHERSGVGVPQTDLVAEFGLTPDVIDRIVNRLKARGLIANVQGDINGYIPGRAASSITLESVLSAFRSSDVELAEGTTSPTLRALVADLDDTRKKRTQGLTIADLMPEASGPVPTPIGSK